MTKLEIRKGVLFIVAYCDNADSAHPYSINKVNTFDISEIVQITLNVEHTTIVLRLKGCEAVSHIKCNTELQASEYYRKLQDIMLENCLKKSNKEMT